MKLNANVLRARNERKGKRSNVRICANCNNRRAACRQATFSNVIKPSTRLSTSNYRVSVRCSSTARPRRQSPGPLHRKGHRRLNVPRFSVGGESGANF